MPWMTGQQYLDANPDVKKAGVDPLYHVLKYVLHGPKEPRPLWIDDQPQPPPPTNPGPPVLVADCAPKRTMLMMQEISNRLLGVEKAQEEARNETVWVQAVAELIGKNTGLNLQAYIDERERLQRMKNIAGCEDTLIEDSH